MEESELLNRIQELAGQGKTRKEIATELGVTEGAVRFRMREHKIPARGTRGPKPKEKPVGLPSSVLEALARVDAAPNHAARLEALEVLAVRVRLAAEAQKTS